MTPDSRVTPATNLRDSAAANLRYIRAAMDASGAFTSVPGAGAVAVGVLGTGAGLAVMFTPLGARWPLVWLVAAALAAPVGAALLARKAAASGTTLGSGLGRRFLFALLPGFVAAALLSGALLRRGDLALVPATWLMLYGASVTAAGALSVQAVRLLGITCMVLGALTLAAPAPERIGQLALLLGFGLAHIAFGTWIWRRHGG